MNLLWHLGQPRPCRDEGPAFGIAREVRRHPDRTLGFWVLGLPLRGRLAVMVGDTLLSADGGGFYLLPPRVPHRAGPAEADGGTADIAYFHFTCATGSTSVPLSGRRPRHLDYSGLVALLSDAAADGLLSDAVFSQQLGAVLGQLVLAAARAPVPAAAQGVADAVLDLLRTRFAESLPAARIARLMGYSYGHLDRCFRQTFGTSIHVRLVRIRVDAARSQLLHGRSVAAAAACGFGDEGHFRKVFTRLVGMPPGRFAAAAPA